MGRYVSLAALAVVGPVLALGCSSDHTHPPPLGGGSPVNPIDHVGAGPGSGGGAGVADSGSNVGTGIVVGTVAVYNDANFVTSTPFTGTGTITVRGTHDVTADFTGPNVTVDQVDPLPTLWAGIKATSNAADLMPTIAPIDGTASSVSIVFGRTSTLAQILATAVKTPVDLQSNAAQIVLSFASAATSTPISGVQIASLNGASTSFGALIYDFDTTYSDQQGATAGRGTAVIANAATTASSPFPGDKAHVAYSFPVKTSSGTMGTSLQNVDVYVSPGALTIARVLINQ